MLLGDGRGGFTPGGDYPAGKGPSSIADFPDGLPGQLLVADAQGNAVTALFNQNGTFMHSQTYSIGTSPVSIWSSQINPGYPFDAVTANANGTVSVFLGTRGLPLFHKPNTSRTCASPKSVVSYDINSDGKPDLILACADGVGVMLQQ